MADVAPDSTLSSTPPSKKLKQGRLPFKPLPTKDVQTVSPLLAGAASKKRKLSDSANTSKAKCPKSDENSPKLNVKKVEAGDNEVSSSSETLEQVIKTKHVEKDVPEKGKKCNSLEQFLQKPQQLEVSTTNIVDVGVHVDSSDSDDTSLQRQGFNDLDSAHEVSGALSQSNGARSASSGNDTTKERELDVVTTDRQLHLDNLKAIHNSTEKATDIGNQVIADGHSTSSCSLPTDNHSTESSTGACDITAGGSVQTTEFSDPEKPSSDILTEKLDMDVATEAKSDKVNSASGLKGTQSTTPAGNIETLSSKVAKAEPEEKTEGSLMAEEDVAGLQDSDTDGIVGDAAKAINSVAQLTEIDVKALPEAAKTDIDPQVEAASIAKDATADVMEVTESDVDTGEMTVVGDELHSGSDCHEVNSTVSKSATGDNNVQTTGDDSAPTTGDDDAPTTGDDDAPTTGGDDGPTTGDDDAPTTGDDDAPTTGGDDAPTTGDDGAPTTGDDGAPTTGGDKTSAATEHSTVRDCRVVIKDLVACSSPAAGPSVVYEVGQGVFAKWTDRQFYPGKVEKINDNGTYGILFDDGYRITAKPNRMKPFPEGYDPKLDPHWDPPEQNTEEETDLTGKRRAAANVPSFYELDKRWRQEEQEQRQKEREERERLKREEREKREREKEELKQKKEEERLEKIRLKEEEKKKKEEERQRLREEKEAEKQRLKEEKEKERQRELEEKMMINAKQQESFKSFFNKKERPEAELAALLCGRFLQFQVKAGMRLAPLRRVPYVDYDDLDQQMMSQESAVTYLQQLKQKDYIPGKAEKTWKIDDEEVICMDEEAQSSTKRRMKAKFFKFQENYRPAYYGTWRKKTTHISARRPLGKDTDQLDYEVDSDDEWEEEEPGESLSDCEKDKDDDEEAAAGDDDDEEDDGFFVPHGYLSEGEGCEDDEEDTSPERLKLRQLAKAKRWENEMSAKVAALRPVCVGCFWWSPQQPQAQTPEYQQLAKYQAVCLMVTPVPLDLPPIQVPSGPEIPANSPPVIDIVSDEDEVKEKSADVDAQKPARFPAKAIPDLIRLVHGKQSKIKALVLEFGAFWKRKQRQALTSHEADESRDNDAAEDSEQPGLANVQIRKAIKRIASYDQVEHRWMVKESELAKHGLSDLALPDDQTSSEGVKSEGANSPSDFPCQGVADLIRLVHGSPRNMHELMREFRTFWIRKHRVNSERTGDTPENNEHELTKPQLRRAIKRIATYDQLKHMWLVKQSELAAHALTDLPVPSQWKWVTWSASDYVKNAGKASCSAGNKRKSTTTMVGPAAKMVHKDVKVVLHDVASPHAKDRKTPGLIKFDVPGMSPKAQTVNKNSFNTPKSVNRPACGKNSDKPPRRLATTLITSTSPSPAVAKSDVICLDTSTEEEVMDCSSAAPVASAAQSADSVTSNTGSTTVTSNTSSATVTSNTSSAIVTSSTSSASVTSNTSSTAVTSNSSTVSQNGTSLRKASPPLASPKPVGVQLTMDAKKEEQEAIVVQDKKNMSALITSVENKINERENLDPKDVLIKDNEPHSAPDQSGSVGNDESAAVVKQKQENGQLEAEQSDTKPEVDNTKRKVSVKLQETDASKLDVTSSKKQKREDTDDVEIVSSTSADTSERSLNGHQNDVSGNKSDKTPAGKTPTSKPPANKPPMEKTPGKAAAKKRSHSAASTPSPKGSKKEAKGAKRQTTLEMMFARKAAPKKTAPVKPEVDSAGEKSGTGTEESPMEID